MSRQWFHGPRLDGSGAGAPGGDRLGGGIVVAGPVVVLTVRGEVDSAVGALWRAYVDVALGASRPGAGVVLDLAAVRFLGCEQSLVVLAAHERCSRAGKRLCVAEADPLVARSLAVAATADAALALCAHSRVGDAVEHVLAHARHAADTR